MTVCVQVYTWCCVCCGVFSVCVQGYTWCCVCCGVFSLCVQVYTWCCVCCGVFRCAWCGGVRRVCHVDSPGWRCSWTCTGVRRRQGRRWCGRRTYGDHRVA